MQKFEDWPLGQQILAMKRIRQDPEAHERLASFKPGSTDYEQLLFLAILDPPDNPPH